MAVTTVADLNSLYNTIYDDALFVAREMNLMANLVTNVGATGWMNRVVSIRPQVTAQSVAETQEVNNPTTMGLTSHATITPGEIAAQAWLTKRDIETDPHGAADATARELGASMATKIDVDLIGDFASFSTDKGDGAGGTATFENLAAAFAVVRTNSLNSDGPPMAVLHPYAWHDIWLELGKPAATMSNLAEITTQALRDYYVTTLMGGARIFTSANITSGTAAVSGVFTRSAIYLDTRRPITAETPVYDSAKRATRFDINAGYGHGLVRSTYGVKFTTDASEPS